MTSPLGQTFAPTGSADDEISRKPNAAQQAIQVLSMRLPRVRGARSISPLLGEPGSAARRETPGGFSADSAVLQTLMRAQQPSAPMGSMPGGGDPMSSAMAALGGGMMNSDPGAPPSQPPSQMPQAPWTPLPPNVVPAEDGPAPRTNPRNQTPTQDGFMDNPNAGIGPASGGSTGGGLPPGAQPPIQQPPSRPEFPGANKPGPMAGQDMNQILGAFMDALRQRM